MADASEALAQQMVDSFALRSVEEEQLATARRIMMSKSMCDRAEHELVVEVKGPKGITSFFSTFPDKVASYQELQNQRYGEITDARWFVSNQDKVVTSREHLVGYKQVVEGARTLMQEYGMQNQPSVRTCIRPHVTRLPPSEAETDKAYYVLGEAEMAVPVVVDNDYMFRFSIIGRRGTDGSTKSTDWISGKALVSEANHTFQFRKKILASLRAGLERVGPGGRVYIPPTAALYTGISMAFRTDGFDTAGAFFTGKTIPFKDENHAMLTNFAMFWRPMNGGKGRALAIGSATVAFKYKPPAQGTDPGHECAVCLDSVLRREWMCTTCSSHVHAACIGVWQAQCMATGRQRSCPLCRAAF